MWVTAGPRGQGFRCSTCGHAPVGRRCGSSGFPGHGPGLRLHWRGPWPLATRSSIVDQTGPWTTNARRRVRGPHGPTRRPARSSGFAPNGVSGRAVPKWPARPRPTVPARRPPHEIRPSCRSSDRQRRPVRPHLRRATGSPGFCWRCWGR